MFGFIFIDLIPNHWRVLPTRPMVATAAMAAKCVLALFCACGLTCGLICGLICGPISAANGQTAYAASGQSANPSQKKFSDNGKLTSATRPLRTFAWKFGRVDDPNYTGMPEGWSRYRGIGYPNFVHSELVAKDPLFEKKIQRLDAWLINTWQTLQEQADNYPWLSRIPTPPSVGDLAVDRYLRVELDGGQFKLQSPAIESARQYQYQLSCDVMTEGLRYDSVRIEFVFLDKNDKEISVRSSPRVSGTRDWERLAVKMVRPPIGVAKMAVRLIIERSSDGFEDIRGTIGFDNVRIDQFPQLRVTTDQPNGVYVSSTSVECQASVLGLGTSGASVGFELLDHQGNVISKSQLEVTSKQRSSKAKLATDEDEISNESHVRWKTPIMDPGFYRVIASIDHPEPVIGPDQSGMTASVSGHPWPRLVSETTFVVIDPSLQGPVHGPFGWTLPKEVIRQSPRELSKWLTDLGVAWIKYPCWLSPDDRVAAEKIATMMAKLQESGIQTIGMLDSPPANEVPSYDLRSRRDLVAAQLFRDPNVWQPKLETVMSVMTLKVRKWQIGGEKDFSFLGRPHLRDSVKQISKGLQGYGQPIEVAISWPWLEKELPESDTTWRSACRSAEPSLQATELDQFLSLSEGNSPSTGPTTWLLLDPIDKSQYDQENRVRDLILRMATVRSHRVEAAFLSKPHDPQRGILKPDGRPDELLLPWRTTSRVIGDLRKAGSLRLRGGSESIVFVGDDRAVMMLWSPEPTKEKLFLGYDVKQVDAWGRVTPLPVIPDPIQPHQLINVGPVPIFITGVDPVLLAFRMSVKTQPKQFDSLLGQQQKLSVMLTNPTRESLVGSMRVRAPEAWTITDPMRTWETLAGRSLAEQFDVVLGNTAKIGSYELPIQFELDTVPPKLVTVYREITVGPEGLLVKVTTRLLKSGELRVRIDITNRSARRQAYNAHLFAPGRQYQSTFIEIKPDETVRREIYWENGRDLIGQQLILRAREQDGDRVMNYSIDVNR
ncbi:hypothetical protein LF1_44560 [Rubripirellula obstinata]|uniref:Alpha-galactosidase NEW3 domain-containing protein n=1 Tax=Rubripirellula obstinata TaxID=406547 RepID=A0A5B1CPL8_9BACT|nr:hypothetical protein [Rubripirellula obstinata]KAA1261895.1 hypothetical protein LF1_44560 [Rubripirellula obstinata]